MKKEKVVNKRYFRMMAGAMGVSALMAVGVAHAGVTQINKAKVKKLMSEDTGKVQGKTVVYSGSHPHVVVEQVLPGFPFPSFEVDKQVNPTIVIPASAKKVTFTVINTNSGAEHSFMVTKKGPPYSAMPSPSALHAVVKVPELPAASGGTFNTDTVTWTNPPKGTWHYLCQTPGHASTGMHGTIKVK